MIRLSFCLLALSAFASLSSAQTQNIVWHKDSSATTGSANTFPWSQLNIRYQTLLLGSQLNNTPCLINDVFVAPQLTMTPNVRTAIYHDIEIRMGMTDVASLVTDWNKNNPNPTTVYRGPLRVTFEKGAWRGLGLPNAFLYVPTGNYTNLCIEFIIWSADTASLSGIRALTGGSAAPVQRAFYYQWVTSQTTPPTVDSSGAKMGILCNDGNFVVIGDGCMSSASTPLAIGATTWPQSGQPFDLLLTGAKPTSPALLVLGASFTQFGPLTLPFDLAPLGAPGCLVWNDHLAIGGTATDPSGNAKLTLPTLPTGLAGVRVYLHWMNLDTGANALGLTTSSLGKMLLGK